VAAVFEPRYLTPWQTLALAVGENSCLQAIRLNCQSDDVTLVPQMTKPFDALAEGLISKNSRGNWTAIELFSAGLASWEAVVRGLIRD
jgi:hypothetical protein